MVQVHVGSSGQDGQGDSGCQCGQGGQGCLGGPGGLGGQGCLGFQGCLGGSGGPGCQGVPDDPGGPGCQFGPGPSDPGDPGVPGGQEKLRCHAYRHADTGQRVESSAISASAEFAIAFMHCFEPPFYLPYVI